MKRLAAWLGLLVLLLAVLPVGAQTRAWLDRGEIAEGETVALNVQTDQAVDAIDFSPLQAQFDIGGQSVRRSFELVNGHGSRSTLFAVGLRPRAAGVYTIPALHVGNAVTEPLRLTVRPAVVQPADAHSDVFVETVVDDPQPYVQQAVGVTVRLNYAVPLLSGELDLPTPEHASLQQVGEDVRSSRDIDGRRYQVVERHYLLIPERSGPLQLPQARFNGISASGMFDSLFDDEHKPLTAASTPQQLQVRPEPAGAPQPWLPLHDLQLRWLQRPQQARVGEAASAELELRADGATDALLPALEIPETPGVQVFPEPTQGDLRFVDGRPQATVRRRIALVPTRAGALTVQGPTIVWWDAVHGVARRAQLPPLQLQVAPGGAQAATSSNDADTGADTPAQTPAATPSAQRARSAAWRWPALAALAVLVIGMAFWIWRRRRQEKVQRPTIPAGPTLDKALASGDLGAIAQALARLAGTPGADLDTVRDRLVDADQQEALTCLQAARWGKGETATALHALRAAFARGPHWRSAGRGRTREPLPPLYPER